MANIRIDLEATVINGQALTFKSPADCSQVTGLIIYYPVGNTTTSKTFKFVDAHGVDVGSGEISLFAENVLVKVILDTDSGKAYVQNADTNAYLEGRLDSLSEHVDEHSRQVAILDSRMDTFASLPNGSTTGDAELADIRVGHDGKKYPTAGDAVRGQVNQISKEIDEQENALMKLENTVTQKIYEEIGEAMQGIVNKDGTIYGADIASYDGRYVEIDVTDGEKYLVSGMYFNIDYQCAFTTGESVTVLVGSNGLGENSAQAETEITIPKGANKLYVNGFVQSIAYAPPIVKKIELAPLADTSAPDPIYVKVSNGNLYTKSAYGNGKDVTVKFGKRGGNSLPDFISFAISTNDSIVIDANAETETFLNPDTDWHAPFVVQAVNNADGDMPSGYASHFTGGNHAYSNGSTGSDTARCETLKYYINGKEVAEYEGYADTVKVFWRNYVQGNNTKKEDGTGREILCEEHTLSFDGKEWISEVEIIPLEDVIIKTWYGLQICGLSSSRYAKIKYINAKNRVEYDVTASSVSGNNACDGMVAFGDTHKLICEIDNQYDLGKREFYTGNQGAFAMTYGKAYFTVIQGSNTFVANTHYYLRGKYRFEQMP